MRAVVMALMLAACASTPAGHGYEGDWKLSGATDPAPTLSFTEDGAAGFSGCNRWFATLTEHRGWRFTNVGSTRMACPGLQMETERAFLSMLGSAHVAGITGDVLILEDESGVELARFERDAAPNR